MCQIVEGSGHNRIPAGGRLYVYDIKKKIDLLNCEHLVELEGLLLIIVMYLRDQFRHVSKVKQQANNNNTIIVTVSSVGKFCSFSLLQQTFCFLLNTTGYYY